MPKSKGDLHILEKLGHQRIPVFVERGAENNRQILESIALNGAMLKYDVKKKTRMSLYSTVSRRIDDLTERGYLAEAEKRFTQRGRQTEESMYGLTWKGFLASLVIDRVRTNPIQVLRIQSLLSFPEKQSILTIAEEILTQEEVKTIADSFVEAFLQTIPNIELIENEQFPVIVLSILPKLSRALPKDFKLTRIPRDAWELLDRPAILNVVKKTVVPWIKQWADQTKALYMLFSTFEGFDKFFLNLDADNKPSRKIKKYFEMKLRDLSKLNQKRKRLGSEK